MLFAMLPFPNSPFPQEFSRSLYPVEKRSLLSKRANIFWGNRGLVSVNPRSRNSK